MTVRAWLGVAGIVGALGVALGAFGAHALPSLLAGLGVPETELPQRRGWFETGSRYHLIHAVALLALTLSAPRPWPLALTVASVAWLLGILVFSGCLYAMALTGLRILGAIVPVGGLALIVGWVAVVVAAWRWPQ